MARLSSRYIVDRIRHDLAKPTKLQLVAKGQCLDGAYKTAYVTFYKDQGVYITSSKAPTESTVGQKDSTVLQTMYNNEIVTMTRFTIYRKKDLMVIVTKFIDRLLDGTLKQRYL